MNTFTAHVEAKQRSLKEGHALYAQDRPLTPDGGFYLVVTLRELRSSCFNRPRQGSFFTFARELFYVEVASRKVRPLCLNTPTVHEETKLASARGTRPFRERESLWSERLLRRSDSQKAQTVTSEHTHNVHRERCVPIKISLLRRGFDVQTVCRRTRPSCERTDSTRV